MSVFIFLFTFLLLVYLFTINKQYSINSRLIQTIICSVLLISIQGLRHECVGIDSWNAYRPYFESATSGLSNLFNFSDLSYAFEPGFVLFTKLIKTVVNDVQFYFIICSIISIAPIAYLIYKYSDNIPLSFIIFSSFILYHFGFSGIRQATAIGLTAIAFEQIIQRKPIKFGVFVLLASTIHTSAIVFIIAYPLYNYLKLTPKRMILFGFLFILLLLFLKPIVLFLTDFLFGGEKYMNKAMEDSIPSYNLMILLAVIMLFTFFSKDNRMAPLRSLLFMTVIFQSLGLISSSASRVAYYFMPYISLAIPMTTKYFKQKCAIEFLISALFIAFFFFCNAGGYLEVIPYKFYWE